MIFAKTRGIHVPHRKNTMNAETVTMPTPPRVVISMQQHIGAPCVPAVKAGDEVKIGQVVGQSDKFVSAPVHSSVQGTVKAVSELLMPSGARVPAVVIDASEEQSYFEGLAPPKIDTKEEFLEAVRQSGLVGLGGAGFPTHVKLGPPPEAPIDTLIINAAECEPYITSDYREIMENSWDIMSGIYTVSEMLEIPKTVIAVEDNKPEAIKILREIADSNADIGDKVTVKTLKSKYPQGAEKVLIYAVTGRKVPAGGLPSDVGCMVMNVTSIAALSRYIKTGIPLISKRLTVDGSAVAEPKNVLVPVGTPVSEVFKFTGGFKKDPRKLIMGGPMMGVTLIDPDMPVLKQNNAILAFDSGESRQYEQSDCIRCGKCASACPMKLTPPAIARAMKLGNKDELNRLSVNTCMECGCCSFECPAKIRIVQSMKLSKTAAKGDC